MKNERILSHKMSQKLTMDELESVSGAGTSVATARGTYSSSGGSDVEADIHIDI